MNKDIMRAIGLGKEVGIVEAGRCPFCLRIVRDGEFVNESSRKEYTISGLCQSCQDATFKEEE